MANFIIFQIFLIISIISSFSRILGYRHLNNETEHCLSADSPKGEAKLCYYHYDEEALRERVTEYPIHPMILGRRSHIRQTGDPMTDSELLPLLEAMRWGPSNYNIQPWRVVYAHHGTPKFQEFLNLLPPGNQIWCKNSSVLMIVVTDMWSIHNGKKSFLFTQGFSTGVAIGNLLFEGTARGYLVHIIQGYDREKLAGVLCIEGNPHFEIEMMIAIGKREPASRLQGQKKDITSQRKKISDIISMDVFKSEWR